MRKIDGTPEEVAAHKKRVKQEWYKRNRDISIARAKTRRAGSDEWRRQNRERVNAVEAYRRVATKIGSDKVEHDILITRFRRHGLTLDQYHAMAEAQDFMCCICGEVPVETYGGSHDGFHIDHHHVTGRIRGLLCDGCNVGIGMLKDSPEVCELAAHYLRSR